MAMIDAARAQELLDCDDATFSNYVNNGTLRSQRVNGQLMVEEKDVEALLSGGLGDSSDSILVLDGESEDLSIDLGEVDGDEGAATLFDTSVPSSQHGTDQITFGDELEVVSFDDGGTEQLDFGDDSEQTVSFDDSEVTVSFDDSEMTVAFDDGSNTEGLSFTESNTAVITDVDDTMMVTGTSDYQTVDDYDDEATGSNRSGASSVRRSVRAERVRQPIAKVSPAWIVILILTLLLSAALIAPYYVVAVWPRENQYHQNGSRAVGLDDNAWANIAAMFVGFDVEPHPDTWRARRPDAQDPHRPLSDANPEQVNVWRYQTYRGRFREPGERARYFFITRVEEESAGDGEFRSVRAFSTAPDGSQLGEFQIRERRETVGAQEQIRRVPDITPASYR